MTSLAVVVYLMAIAVPRVEDIGEKKNGSGSINLPLDRLDALLGKAKDKALRRLRVVVMKTDNFISRQLNNKEEKL
ncbi:MAG: hypothetical protein A3C03_00895 [Candidatus Colwellbacteria bacterium RIFCSPHIGHO2_02_FULL_45_17]|uniref:Uncharacterized protein n=3 Tax=Parcubacteria group TaxID=1794811 RepID=A0A0H4T6T6_9BACT|nr:hypothetical protein [uncultured Parcubacteria bacterium Rifle_16ft_4_minimus_37647]OGY57607.1 MAG: hypothetical protein A3C03_00895 [Candidatus Colwellbacteria bacterium RIFCSPHIGHO2_02_FULL_45_17]OGY61659.1 MAG: hypothetical protein A3I33_01040 [Candidatus Colwellbacteria bacterium RIFCSPLOWO2_02_FULL_45_11]OGY62755.1 MAG: hypothetical protein A3G58_02405 [Candidatus Colwellbacteria bacterium RIFCSPLOWO2_12_FULL_46_17]